MEIFLTDGHCRTGLFPFTEIRHTAELRIGILTIKEKWERLTGAKVHLVQNHSELTDNQLHIHANVIPTRSNFNKIIAASKSAVPLNNSDDIKILDHPWQISLFNNWAIRQDFELITTDRLSDNISQSNRVLNNANVFIEKGVKMEFCILNADDGPIYIGGNAQVMEGSMLRGPLAICENVMVKMGSKIYSGTTIGPNCIAGGEIKNTVMIANSNKAHDGYLGDSVIGEWCNLGAGTSNSNLKNNATDVYFNSEEGLINAGNKTGLMLGDYSRSAINTSFNTGTIVGISCNLFGTGMPPRYIPSFSWGEKKYELDKALRDIDNWMRLKNKSLSEGDELKLTELYNK